MTTFLLVFLVFGGMIFLHELGHFLAARLFKIEVEEFGFGLPPKALTLFHWQGTEFTLNWLPLGGFVRPKGEGDPDVPDGLAAASPLKRIVVLLAGPLMNLLTAVVVTALLIALTGIPVPGQVLMQDVVPDSPAAQAGILPKDVILSISGQSVSTLEEAKSLIAASVDKPLTLTLQRNGETIQITATPLSSRSPEQGALGVSLGYEARPATPVEIIGGGFVYTGLQSAGVLYLPVAILKGEVSGEDARLVGLKGIYDFFGQALQRDVESRAPASAAAVPGAETPVPASQPTYYVLSLVISLSVSLGVFNLLPIPALDGGRILFALSEILFRRRLPAPMENAINGVAMLGLIALMLFINVMDFINPANIQLP